MLELINRYTHGYVAVPVILACEKKGFFQLLKERGSADHWIKLVPAPGSQ